jgi:hypothetical protein
MGRRFFLLFTALALTGLTTIPASAAAPKVAGKYAVMSWLLCQSKSNTTTGNYAIAGGGSAPAVSNFSVPDTGTISVEVGVITFPATASSSGNASLALINIVGSAVRHKNGSGAFSGIQIQRKTSSPSGPFSFTATTFTLGDVTFDMRAGDIVNGVARTVYLVRADSSSCLLAISATKQ